MTTISKTDLIKTVSGKTGYSAQGTGQIIDAFLAEISELTAAGHSVALHKFGKFVQRERAARVGRNPRTGEAVEIAAHKTLAFKASKSAV